MGKYVLFLCCVFVRSEKKLLTLQNVFFICHWLCAIPELYVMWFVDIFSHFCPFPSLGIEKSGVVDFFPLSLCPVHKIKFERNAKISNILYREKTLNLIDQCYY